MRLRLTEIIRKDMVLKDIERLFEQQPFDADTKGLTTLILYVGENQRKATHDSYDRSVESIAFLSYVLHKLHDKGFPEDACAAVKGFISAYKEYNTHPKGAFEELNSYENNAMTQMRNILNRVPDFENILIECRDDWAKSIYGTKIPEDKFQDIPHHFSNMVAEISGYVRLSGKNYN